MFLSTVVPSAMLNSQRNIGPHQNQFTVPYDFTKGKNLVFNITPLNTHRNTATYGQHNNGLMTRYAEFGNRQNVEIPVGVNVHSFNMNVVGWYAIQTREAIVRYTLTITMDVLKSTITFKPISYNIVSGDNIGELDYEDSMPTLIVVQTVS